MDTRHVRTFVLFLICCLRGSIVCSRLITLENAQYQTIWDAPQQSCIDKTSGKIEISVTYSSTLKTK